LRINSKRNGMDTLLERFGKEEAPTKDIKTTPNALFCADVPLRNYSLIHSSKRQTEACRY